MSLAGFGGVRPRMIDSAYSCAGVPMLSVAFVAFAFHDARSAAALGLFPSQSRSECASASNGENSDEVSCVTDV